jgi:hypothetical protein
MLMATSGSTASATGRKARATKGVPGHHDINEAAKLSVGANPNGAMIFVQFYAGS